jgi:hypothetical protein
MSTESIFILITFLSLVGLFLGTSGDKWVSGLFVLWAVFTGALSYNGFYLDTEGLPPRIMTVLVPSAVLVIYAYRRLKVASLNLSWLIAIHILRIPVELLLYRLFLEGLVPVSMTFKGWNLDILSGLTAIGILALHLKGRLSLSLLRVWNVMVLVLLSIIVSIAILSAPSPLQAMAFDRPNLAVLRFPYTWLPAIVVPVVLLSSLYIFKCIRQAYDKDHEVADHGES